MTFDEVIDWLVVYLDPEEYFDPGEFAYELKHELLALRPPEDPDDACGHFPHGPACRGCRPDPRDQVEYDDDHGGRGYP